MSTMSSGRGAHSFPVGRDNGSFAGVVGMAVGFLVCLTLLPARVFPCEAQELVTDAKSVPQGAPGSLRLMFIEEATGATLDIPLSYVKVEYSPLERVPRQDVQGVHIDLLPVGVTVKADGSHFWETKELKKGVAEVKAERGTVRDPDFALGSNLLWRFTQTYSAIDKPRVVVIADAGAFTEVEPPKERGGAALAGGLPSGSELRFLFYSNAYTNDVYPAILEKHFSHLVEGLPEGASDFRVVSVQEDEEGEEALRIGFHWPYSVQHPASESPPAKVAL